MRELLTSVLATVMLPMISVSLFASENTFSFLSNCDKENLMKLTDIKSESLRTG